jgi:hypothetical protein
MLKFQLKLLILMPATCLFGKISSPAATAVPVKSVPVPNGSGAYWRNPARSQYHEDASELKCKNTLGYRKHAK